MNIANRVLTLNQNVANGTVECIGGCRVELNALEIAGLAVPGNPGFTLRCVLEGVDVGPDRVLFTFPLSRTFKNVLNILDADDIFTSSVSTDVLDEDANGNDEVRAVFTLVNNSNGQRVRRKSGTVTIALRESRANRAYGSVFGPTLHQPAATRRLMRKVYSEYSLDPRPLCRKKSIGALSPTSPHNKSSAGAERSGDTALQREEFPTEDL